MKSKFNRIRKIKYYLYKYKIHKVLPGEKLKFIGHLSSLSRWISEHRELEYTTFPNKNFDYSNRYKLFEYIFDAKIKNLDIDYLEFGVYTGNSFKWWMEKINNPNAKFYGFDTFSGLPEDWGPFKKGDMSGGEIPKIEGNRHTFYEGIFQKTLFDFLKTYNSDKKKIIHFDADLYSSTLFVLTSLSPYLKKGDILLFDEFNVPMHEYKALKDWSESFYIDYSVIGEVNNYYQIAIELK